jgi:hypothetical protein
MAKSLDQQLYAVTLKEFDEMEFKSYRVLKTINEKTTDIEKAKIELKREQDAKAVAIEASGQTLDILSSNPKLLF